MERTRTHNLAVGSVCKLRAETLPTQPPRHPDEKGELLIFRFVTVYSDRGKEMKCHAMVSAADTVEMSRLLWWYWQAYLTRLWRRCGFSFRRLCFVYLYRVYQPHPQLTASKVSLAVGLVIISSRDNGWGTILIVSVYNNVRLLSTLLTHVVIKLPA